MKKVKKVRSIKNIKKQLWGLISQYIRMKYSNLDGLCFCFTCGKPHYWKDMECGHFIHGKDKPTGYMEMNLHPQDTYCNKYLSGNHKVYREKLIEKYGKEKVEEMESLRHQVIKRDRDFYAVEIARYKELVGQEMARLKIF